MEILLARHGNTFEAGETPVWVGKNNDLPLTAEGEAQAHRLGAALRRQRLFPDAIFCGTLQRTRRFAQIVVDEIAADDTARVDPRLDEIDYGDWAGLSNAEIEARPAWRNELKAWNERGVWPASANWRDAEVEIAGRVEGLLADVITRYPREARLLLVTSNGILRFFAKAGSLAPEAAKMKTGHLGKLIFAENAFNLAYWNRVPGTAPL
jgi:probable phosphoglycerate mutase